MRVSLITSVPMVPPWDQGDKNYAYALSQALPGLRFRVLTARQAAPPAGPNLTAAAVFRHKRATLGDKARVYHWLLRQERSTDLFHFIYRPYALSSRFCRWLPSLRGRPVLHTVPATGLGQVLHRSMFFADVIVAMSQYGYRLLQEMGLAQTVFIPAGIDTERWSLLAGQGTRYKAALGLEGRPVVLFPGHYGPGYGATTMFLAALSIVKAVPEVCILFACRPRSRQDLRRERLLQRAAERAGLRHHFRFLRTVPDMAVLIGAADVTALPLETMRDKVDIPTTLLESLAAGKPIVISDLPPLNEIFHGANVPAGRLIAPGNEMALSQAVVDLLQDEGQRRTLGQAGQQLVQACYSIRQAAQRYADLYASLGAPRRSALP